MGKAIDLAGKRFKKLKVIEPAGKMGGHLMWLCECDCGRKSIVRGGHLKQGVIVSCGKCERTKEQTTDACEAGSLSLSRLKRDTDPYRNLANAIVAVAADDYRDALANNNEKSKRSLERFFYSEWYSVLTNVSADFLLGLLLKEYNNNLQRVYI